MRKIFSNGVDGAESIASPTTENPITSTCSGTSTTDQLAADAAYVAGQVILIYQARGTGAGVNIEMNQVKSYNDTTNVITTEFPLAFTYATSGNDVAHVQVVPQLDSYTNDSTHTGKAWNEAVGGLFIKSVSGKFWNKSGKTIDLRGQGFLGGVGVNQNANPSQAMCGEGTGGARGFVRSRNNNGGGGGLRTQTGGGVDTGGGGAGANSALASNGSNNSNPSNGGIGGIAVGGNAFDTDGIFMGGGGGAAPGADPVNFRGGHGGDGGPVAIIICDEFLNEGTIDLRGADPDNSPHGGNQDGDAAAGAGGSLWVICRRYTNTGTITGVQGTYSTGGTIGPCGHATTGRIQVDTCAETAGNTNSDPVATKTIGGHDYCQAFIHIY